MDILAARKKAAELAKARVRAEAQQAAAPEPETPVQHAPEPASPEATAGSMPPLHIAPVEQAPAQPEPAPAEATESAAAEEPAQAQEMEMLSFRLGQEEYVVMVDDVKEVLKNRELTPVPNAPDYVLGVTSLRGAVLSVIDLCKRLHIQHGVRDEKSRILVVHLEAEDTCIIVDRVTGVVRIDPEAVRPVPDTVEHGSEYLSGIARKDDKLYILLDIEKALAA